MVVIYENHKRNESQEVITTIQGIDEEKGQREKKRHKRHLGHLKIKKKKGPKMLEV